MSAPESTVECVDCLTVFDKSEGMCPQCWHRVCQGCGRFIGDRAVEACGLPECADSPDSAAL